MWVRSEERQPASSGWYRVRRSVRSGQTEETMRYYNGGYWVTLSHGVCTSVLEWWEEEADG